MSRHDMPLSDPQDSPALTESLLAQLRLLQRKTSVLRGTDLGLDTDDTAPKAPDRAVDPLQGHGSDMRDTQRDPLLDRLIAVTGATDPRRWY